MTQFLFLLGGIISALVVAFVYITLAANAEANHQDRVMSVPLIGPELDAFLRARRGVMVRLVLNSEGTEPMPRELVDQMRDAGCKVTWFRRMRWFDWMKYNHRTHRRLLIVDGKIGFTGGVGIADEWTGHAQSPSHWRDTHVRLTGPIVAALQSAFTDNWNQSTEELLLDARDFPHLTPTGDVPVCAVLSTPANGASAAQRVMAALIAGSTRTLYISNAYFVPTPAFIDALCAARDRGVDVRVLVPGPCL